ENPVYMMADQASYVYFKEKNLELFAVASDFDGKHGIMAYNKTIQKRGKAHEMRDPEDWIIAVGKHMGLISGMEWIQVQNRLAQNKYKAYHKPRSNVALLSGLLFCGNCGNYMRPKLTQRKNKDGQLIYSYLCSLKESSRLHNCHIKNPNGNLLDELVGNEIKKLSPQSADFIRELQDCLKQLDHGTTQVAADLLRLNKLKDDAEREINSLVTVLSKAAATASEQYIIKQIDALDQKCKGIQANIDELASLSKQHLLSDSEFDLIFDILANFGSTFEQMSLEEKRAALRIFISKAVWDGENVHLYLFGSEGKIDLPHVENATWITLDDHLFAGEDPQILDEDSKSLVDDVGAYLMPSILS
ncbi:MAG: recombinase zinc beta ribbon domain-containing protein, partial [Clostridiales bacterium]